MVAGIQVKDLHSLQGQDVRRWDDLIWACGIITNHVWQFGLPLVQAAR